MHFHSLFKGLIHFPLKDLYHIHKGDTKVFFLCFSYVAILRVYCGRGARLYWRYIAASFIDCAFTLAPRLLVL